MKKTLTVLLIITMLFAGLFVFTGCGNSNNGDNGKTSGRNTTEISYSAPSIYSIKLNVPTEKDENGEEKAVYEFTDEVPEAVKDFFYGGLTYLVGDKVVGSVGTSSYTYQTGVAYKEAHGEVTPSFESFKEFIFEEGSSSTLKDSEQVKIGDREALKSEVRIGTGKGELYGYYYVINIDDLYPRGYMEIRFVTADGTTENVESTFADAEVQAMINSIVISGLK